MRMIFSRLSYLILILITLVPCYVRHLAKGKLMAGILDGRCRCRCRCRRDSAGE